MILLMCGSVVHEEQVLLHRTVHAPTPQLCRRWPCPPRFGRTYVHWLRHHARAAPQRGLPVEHAAAQQLPREAPTDEVVSLALSSLFCRKVGFN